MFTQLWFDYSHITSNTEEGNREAILGDWFQRKGELSWVFLS